LTAQRVCEKKSRKNRTISAFSLVIHVLSCWEGGTRAICTDDSFSHNLLFFFSFSLQFGRVKDDERRARAIFFSFSVYVYAVVAEKYRVKHERCRRRRDKSGFVTGINSFFFLCAYVFFYKLVKILKVSGGYFSE